MKRVSATALAAFALLSGCAGARAPKLAKCIGPFRYANPNGTVLPSLPISGRPTALTPAVEQPVAPPASNATLNATASTPPGNPPAPVQSSVPLRHYPSC